MRARAGLALALVALAGLAFLALGPGHGLLPMPGARPGPAESPSVAATTAPREDGLRRFTVSYALAGAEFVLAWPAGGAWHLVEGASRRPGLGFRSAVLLPEGAALPWRFTAASGFRRALERERPGDWPQLAGFDAEGVFTAYWEAVHPADMDLSELAAAGRPVALERIELPVGELAGRRAALQAGGARVFVLPHAPGIGARREVATPWMWVCRAPDESIISVIEAALGAEAARLGLEVTFELGVERGPEEMVAGPGTFTRRPTAVLRDGVRTLAMPPGLYCPAQVRGVAKCADAASCARLEEADVGAVLRRYRDPAVLAAALEQAQPVGPLKRAHASRAELEGAAMTWGPVMQVTTWAVVARPVE